MKRRHFVLRLAQLSLGLFSLRALAAEMPRRSLDKIGLQLFTVDSLLAENFEDTLKTIAEIGYRQVEFSSGGGLHGRAPAEVRKMLEALGMTAPQGRVRPQLSVDPSSLTQQQMMQVFMEAMSSEKLPANLEAMLPEAEAFGYEALVVSAVPPPELQTMESLKRLAERFNEAGRFCAAHGMKFGYHNHDFDFVPVDGTIPFHFLIENTDPEHVVFQLDAYWASKAGKDPSSYPGRYPGRFTSCHLKDKAADGSIADVGAGTIDFQSFIRSATESGVRHFFVEHDKPADPMATARNSFHYLDALRF